MSKLNSLFLFILLNSLFCRTSAKSQYAIIKSCAGWRLNSLPEIKNFLLKEVNNYPVEVVFPGGDPKLVIMDNEGNEVEEINLTQLNEKGIIHLLTQKGFGKYQ